ncbi:MAG TPA: serine/threonine-protein kinase, partial [Minicystis sp.]|nr:serine/threonine-protein kinase [Minicystis sp.]
MSAFGRRVEQVFDAAIELSGVARARYLDTACARDPALRREVEALLEADAAPRRAPDALARAAIDEVAAPDGGAAAIDGAPAERVGQFEITGRLGEGGLGVVYEAYDARLDRRVALKVVRPGAAAFRARLLREAQALARVAHPNVVAVHEVGDVGDELFIAMELVRGETLRAWLARAERSWRDVLAMFVEAGRGLAAAHAAGLVHRDFKPDNVLVGVDGRPRVVDFGIARAADAAGEEPAPGRARAPGLLDTALTAPHLLLGTPAFMSPEQFEGREVDARTDQFSFAVALYAALFRAPPFEGDDVPAIRASVVTGAVRPPRPGDVPEEVVAAVLRALSRSPAARFATMDAFLEELARPLG